ncbi:MAG: hypothetical protein Q9201_001496 [Fulgogasparrea decipioides]
MDNRKHQPDGCLTSSGQATQPMSMTQVIASAPSSSVAPSTESTRSTHQTRRLQLRNAAFRGQSLPIRRISPISGSSIISPEPFGRVVSSENSPNNSEKRLLLGEDPPPNPVNILQELHDSARRRRHQPRRCISEIFQDDTAAAPVEDGSGVSWYSETSNGNTPLQSRKSPIPMMKLREVSLNGKTPPPLSSPLAKQTRGRNGNRVQLRSTSAEMAKYIEHLESQLVAVNTKLDSLMSPSSHKARTTKFRALTSEARSLRQQVDEWEQKFEERVKGERSQLAEVEMSLTARLQALEDEVEAKDDRVRELDWEMENLRTRVKDAEGLEAVNADLERRIDLLTSLLVQSPTKLELCSAASSPSKADPRKRIARPMSMMPKVPPSPGSKRLSLNIGPDFQVRRSRQSFALASSASPSTDLKSPSAPGREGIHASETMKESKDSSHVGSRNSSSFRSPTSCSSRATSFHSSGSFGAHCWGLPVPLESEADATACHKQRRMRRFPSGAASLKPLILPNATCTASLPASAPVQSIFGDHPRRDFSEVSLDPTVAFLSKHEYSSPVTTPTQSCRKRSSSYAQREALCTLEGQSSTLGDKDDYQSILPPRSFPDEPLETVEEESAQMKLHKRERPRSLHEELAEAGLLAMYPVSNGLIPCSGNGMGRATEPEPVSAQFEASHLRTPCQQQRRESNKSLTIPKLRMAPTKVATPPPKSLASTAVATRQAHGLFSRLTGLIIRTKLGPSALARRLIHNAWAIGMAKLGGMGWWLLGLVYGPRWRKENRAADAETIVAEVPSSEQDWHQISPPGPNEGSDRRQDGCSCDATEDYLNPRISGSKARPFHSTPNDVRHCRPEDMPISRHEANIVPCLDCREHSFRRSFRLWFRFSLAIVLAVGIAIKDSPGVLLEGCQASRENIHKAWQLTPCKIRSIPTEETENSRLGWSQTHIADLDGHRCT